MFDRGEAPLELSLHHSFHTATKAFVAPASESPLSSPKHEIMKQRSVSRSIADIENEGARIQLEHGAGYLIRQVDAIEMNNKDLRSKTKALEAESYDNDNTKYSLCETTAFGTSNPHTPNSLRRRGIVRPLPATPNPISGVALADDLSTINEDGTPAKRRLQELEEENKRLRESLFRCSKAVLEIQRNADLKVVRLEWEVARLRQQLADESAFNSKYICLNQSLRRQLQHVADQIVKNKNDGPSFRQRYEDLRDLHQRELVVEKHMNELIQSRNHAIRDNTALKKLLLTTCYECRQRLPVKRRMSEPDIVIDVGAIDGDESPTYQQQQAILGDVDTKHVASASALSREQECKSSLSRPTYQTSARNILDNLPKQPVAPKFQTPQRCDLSSPMAQPKKSCLKASNSIPPMLTTNNDNYIHRTSNGRSPTTTTALLIDAQSSSTRRSLMPPRLLNSERNLNLSPSRNYENRKNRLSESAVTLSSSSSSQQQQKPRANPATRSRHRAMDEPRLRRASTGTLVIRNTSTSGKRGPLIRDKEPAETAKKSQQPLKSHSSAISGHIAKPLRQPVATHRIEF